MDKQITSPSPQDAGAISNGPDLAHAHGGTVAILLCTFNGEAFLKEQLDSFSRQTYENWVIYASDDGSSDGTLEILRSYQVILGVNRLVTFEGPRQGFAKNFLSLIKNPDITADYFAFSDQDDVWFDDKLERSIAKVGAAATSKPSLYCSRVRLIDANNGLIGYSPLFSKAATFRNALVQSIAGANTMLINLAARELLSETSDQVEIVAHDWLTYLLVSACGGAVTYDALPTLDYRQHDGNIIGANTSFKERWVRLVETIGGRFSRWSSQNLQILKQFEEQITPENRRILDDFRLARTASFFYRMRLISKSGVYRQTFAGNISLALAACLNKI